jgi:hypothetical protein
MLFLFGFVEKYPRTEAVERGFRPRKMQIHLGLPLSRFFHVPATAAAAADDEIVV